MNSTSNATNATAVNTNGSTTVPITVTDNVSTSVPYSSHLQNIDIMDSTFNATNANTANTNSSTTIPVTDNVSTSNEMNIENEMNIKNEMNIENENNNEIQMNAENVPISDLSEIPSIKEYLNTIKSGSSPPASFNHHLTTKILHDKFNDFMYNQSVHHCHYCKERWYDFDSEYNDNIFECKKYINDRKKNFNQIHTFSSENDMDPKIDLMYYLLPELNNIKEMFITCIQPMMKVFKLEKGRIGYKGNVLNIE